MELKLTIWWLWLVYDSDSVINSLRRLIISSSIYCSKFILLACSGSDWVYVMNEYDGLFKFVIDVIGE